jgi:hypothetical protein
MRDLCSSWEHWETDFGVHACSVRQSCSCFFVLFTTRRHNTTQHDISRVHVAEQLYICAVRICAAQNTEGGQDSCDAACRSCFPGIFDRKTLATPHKRHNMTYHESKWLHSFIYVLCIFVQRKTSTGLNIRVTRHAKGVFLVFSTRGH